MVTYAYEVAEAGATPDVRWGDDDGSLVVEDSYDDSGARSAPFDIALILNGDPIKIGEATETSLGTHTVTFPLDLSGALMSDTEIRDMLETIRPKIGFYHDPDGAVELDTSAFVYLGTGDLYVYDGNDVSGSQETSSVSKVGNDVVVSLGSESVTLDSSGVDAVLLYLGDADDVFTADSSFGTNVPLVVHGEGGDDTITGGAETDYIYPGDGADTVDGGGGDDTYYTEEDGALDVFSENDLNETSVFHIANFQTTDAIHLGSSVIYLTGHGALEVSRDSSVHLRNVSGDVTVEDMTGMPSGSTYRVDFGSTTIKTNSGVAATATTAAEPLFDFYLGDGELRFEADQDISVLTMPDAPAQLVLGERADGETAVIRSTNGIRITGRR